MRPVFEIEKKSFRIGNHKTIYEPNVNRSLDQKSDNSISQELYSIPDHSLDSVESNSLYKHKVESPRANTITFTSPGKKDASGNKISTTKAKRLCRRDPQQSLERHQHRSDNTQSAFGQSHSLVLRQKLMKNLEFFMLRKTQLQKSRENKVFDARETERNIFTEQDQVATKQQFGSTTGPTVQPSNSLVLDERSTGCQFTTSFGNFESVSPRCERTVEVDKKTYSKLSTKSLIKKVMEKNAKSRMEQIVAKYDYNSENAALRRSQATASGKAVFVPAEANKSLKKRREPKSLTGRMFQVKPRDWQLLNKTQLKDLEQSQLNDYVSMFTKPEISQERDDVETANKEENMRAYVA